jgi:hypothetical protein
MMTPTDNTTAQVATTEGNEKKHQKKPMPIYHANLSSYNIGIEPVPIIPVSQTIKEYILKEFAKL